MNMDHDSKITAERQAHMIQVLLLSYRGIEVLSVVSSTGVSILAANINSSVERRD
jgi:hypothetical protein